MSFNISNGRQGMGHFLLANLVLKILSTTLPIRRSIIAGHHLSMSFECYVGNTTSILTSDMFGIEDYLALSGPGMGGTRFQGFHPWLLYFTPVGVPVEVE